MSPTVPPEVTFDVQNIHNALTLAVPDQEVLVGIIGRREYQQLVIIARHYKYLYNVDLATELDRRVIGSVGSLLGFACMHRVIAEVQYLHRAGKSNRKYEALRKKDTALEVFCEILVGRAPADLRELHEAFKALHGRDLTEHILSFIKDDAIKEFFTSVLTKQSALEEKPLENVDATVEHFHKLLQNQETAPALEYVASITTSQLGELVRAYNKQHPESHVVTTIEKQWSHHHPGDQVDILLFAVMQAADPARHIALLLEQSMQGLGTNEDQLSRLVVIHRGKTMEKVKASYHIDFSRTLADRVRGDTSGLYSNLICHLINQTI